MWPSLLLCNYKMLKCSTDFSVHGSFSAFEDYLNATLGPGFAGFNCPDFRFRWIQLVVNGFFIFSSFCCYLVCPSEFLCIGRLSLHGATLGLSFAGFNCLDFYVRWIQEVVDLFLLFVVVMWPSLLLCNYKMLKCSADFSVHGSFSAFEDYLNRAIRLVRVSLDSTVLIFVFAGFNLLLMVCCIFCGFCCYLVCPSGFLCISRLSL